MTATAKGRQPVTRPGSSVAIDPDRLLTMRHRRGLKRRVVSERIRELGMRTEHGRLVTMGRDMIGKCETGVRSPSLDATRALCVVLECTVEDLMPGGPVVTMPPTARARQSRLRHNRELRDFAVRHGLRYKNPHTGRVYYSRKLREAYAAEVAMTLARTAGDPAKAEAAQEAYDTALAVAVTSLRLPGTHDEQDEHDEHDEQPLAS